jgi:7-cyano-7-deazaguanine tRNA-ribosyltransferase
MDGLKRFANRPANMPAWLDGTRKDPKPCREQDLGKFEVVHRDGRARLGRLHTQHGILETPALLPVINPNIRSIEPREMWDRYGIGALITNSYIIWKHDELKEKALKDGVHNLLDYPGVIMTDSGTFQSYIYGDVEVGVEEIVNFQRSIGVDIATMLDVFSRPDMDESEVLSCVDETLARAQVSIDAAKDTMINGPIQGGLFRKLREKSATEMGKFDFSIHPIGGIVPVMEQQRYKEYAKIMLSSLPNLPPNRPVHMFGCGHPMLFPMSIALGADLFDSAAYALFARDGRLLTPWGTEKLVNLIDWPVMMPCIASITPEEVRSMGTNDRNKLLSKFNLEVSLAELARCKQAVRDGTIWRMVERRSHQHPALREAFLWLTTNPSFQKVKNVSKDGLFLNEKLAAQDLDQDKGAWELSWDWIVKSQTTPRRGGVSWGGADTSVRPHIIAAKNLLISRWHSITPRGLGSSEVLILHGHSGPWRERCDNLITRLIHHAPGLEVMILTPIGLLPYSLEDINPFTHVEGPDWIWRNRPDLAFIRSELEQFSLDDRKIVTFNLRGDNLVKRAFAALIDSKVLAETSREGLTDSKDFEYAQLLMRRRKAADKFALFFNIQSELSHDLTKDTDFVINRHGRIKNVLTSGGKHFASFRLGDGGLSLNNDGAIELHSIRRRKIPSGFSNSDMFGFSGEGLAMVVVDDDAEPFVRQGRNVFHGFIIACDPWLRPNEACLIVNKSGDLLGHGISLCTPREITTFGKGVAIKTRDGIKLE